MKFLRTPFLQNTSRQLFLKKAMYKKLTYFKAWTVSKHTICWQNNNFNIQRNLSAIVKHSNYSFNKIQLLQKRQFVNYFVKKLNTRQQNLNFCFMSSLKKYGKYAILLSSQSNCSYFYMLTILTGFKGALMQIWKPVNICLYMKIICWRFHIKTPFTFWDMPTWNMRIFKEFTNFTGK